MLANISKEPYFEEPLTNGASSTHENIRNSQPESSIVCDVRDDQRATHTGEAAKQGSFPATHKYGQTQ